jgi:hypothetical protein
MSDIKVRYNPIPNISNERIIINTQESFINRYLLFRFDNTVYEVNKRTYDRVKSSSYFEPLIIIWYIRGTKEFVREKNRIEIDRASKKYPLIKKTIVNLLQFYQDDN